LAKFINERLTVKRNIATPMTPNMIDDQAHSQIGDQPSAYVEERPLIAGELPGRF
jgi:hypothetical protein